MRRHIALALLAGTLVGCACGTSGLTGARHWQPAPAPEESLTVDVRTHSAADNAQQPDDLVIRATKGLAHRSPRWKFDVLSGRYASDGPKRGQVVLRNSEPGVKVTEGFAYVIGKWRWTVTVRVVAGTGTTAVTVRTTDNADWVFLLDKTPGHEVQLWRAADFDPFAAEITPPLPVVILNSANGQRYVRAIGTGTAVQFVDAAGAPAPASGLPIPTDPNDPVRKFVEEVLQRARAAGLDMPAGV